MAKYLKKCLYLLFILLLPCMNIASKANDEEAEARTVKAPKVRPKIESEEQRDSKDAPTPSSHIKQLEDSKNNSWMACASSCVSSVFQSACDALEYATHNPHKAALIGTLWFVYQADALCQCYCFDPNGHCLRYYLEPDQKTCIEYCNMRRLSYDSIGCGPDPC